MKYKDFIFSEKRQDRIKRHLFFCFCVWFYFTFYHVLNAGSPELNNFQKIPFTILEALHVVVPQLLFAYVLIGFVLPRFLLKNRYLLSLFWIILLACATFFLTYILLNYVFKGFSEKLLAEKYMLKNPRTTAFYFMLARLVTMKASLMVGTAACSIKLIKYWHLKEKRNLELLREKTEVQLQLLTAQVHPHFLFNTLNNIYSKAQNESPGSAKMIMELSHILRYVLDEGSQELVLVENELQMLSDYVHLEKLRYGDNLDLHLLISGNTEDIYIAPLILLPFVEKCFKHDIGKALKNQWVNIKIETKNTQFIMKLMYGKNTGADLTTEENEFEIEIVKKRLDMLYMDKYTLSINDDVDVFVVNLALQLERRESSAIPEKESLNDASYVY